MRWPAPYLLQADVSDGDDDGGEGDDARCTAAELEGSGGVADRAAGMILGSLVADAAAMGVHW